MTASSPISPPGPARPRGTRRRPRLPLALAALACAALALAGCGSAAGGDSGKPRVLTTFTVLADMAANVAGDRVEVDSITKPGAEIHGYEPTPSDIAKAADADLILDNGLGLERWFEQFVQTSRRRPRHPQRRRRADPDRRRERVRGQAQPARLDVGRATPTIYVDNIRDALTELDPAAHGDLRRATPSATRRAWREVARLRRAGAERPPPQRAGAGHLRGRVLLPGPRLRPRRGLHLAGQRRAGGHAAADRRGRRHSSASATSPPSSASRRSATRRQRQVAAETGAGSAASSTSTRSPRPDGPVPTYRGLLRHDAETIVAGLTAGASG